MRDLDELMKPYSDYIYTREVNNCKCYDDFQCFDCFSKDADLMFDFSSEDLSFDSDIDELFAADVNDREVDNVNEWIYLID